jgi:hypothetical protein
MCCRNRFGICNVEVNFDFASTLGANERGFSNLSQGQRLCLLRREDMERFNSKPEAENEGCVLRPPALHGDHWSPRRLLVMRKATDA